MKHLLLFTLLAISSLTVRAGGTIQLNNTVLTLVRWLNNQSTAPVPTTPGFVVYGVFWGTNANELTLALPLATNSTSVAGLISCSPVYEIAGTEPGQLVYLQIRGWAAAYGTNWAEAKFGAALYGETQIHQVTLGPTAGPGTVIWGSSSTFHPLTLSTPLTPPAIVSVGPPPGNAVVVDEENGGTVEAKLFVYRTSSTGGGMNYTTTVALWTSNLTALAGQDYGPANLLLTFGPGETVKQVLITVKGDALPEGNEQFAIHMQPAAGSFVAVFTPTIVTIREVWVLSVHSENNHPVVTIQTTSSQRYALESSPDLVSWSTVPGAENIAGTGLPVPIPDPTPNCCVARFYRTRLLR